MTQYNSLNVKLSNSQLKKSKTAIKNETKLVLRLSPNMIGDSNDKNNFPLELLLTNRQVTNRIVVKLFQIIHQLILNFPKLNYQI